MRAYLTEHIEVGYNISRLYSILNVRDISEDTYEMAKAIEMDIIGKAECLDAEGHERRNNARERLGEFYSTNLELLGNEVKSMLLDTSINAERKDSAIESRNRRICVYRRLLENLGQ